MSEWTEAHGVLLLAVAVQLREAGDLVQAGIVEKAYGVLSAPPPREVPLPPLGTLGVPRQ